MNDDSMRKNLTEEELRVLRDKGTEAPFTGTYVHNDALGTYSCKACGTALFSSDTKFDSGTGWPSFTNPVIAEHIGTRTDESHGMTRTEVFCKKCGGHLGHVFPDGPKETGGARYCINSIALDFQEEQ
ncbi:MAG: peptide-methionine (R)-S-oxide reductase MsrB [Candidatus Pacebacteria bacterium]|nr:peptide-methionine (R)-S-oxide reductase MsrB [Candidatus Paceibacterota bacterium]